MSSSDSYVKMVGITKKFGPVIANKDVSFKVKKGEIYALLGENGAGKSTLMNMLSGIYRPDDGTIYIKGDKVNFSKPADSIKKGIGMIHQHFKLVDIMTAKENIILGQEKNFFLNKKKLSDKIKNICDKFGLYIDPDKKIYDMSVGEKQTVEILKVLYRGADILILDEPTAVLTPQETKKLFDILRNMKNEGCAIIIITHKLNEVMEISDWVTVLRKGESVGSVKTSETSPKALTELMVGRSVDLKINRSEIGERNIVMEVKNLTVKDDLGISKIKDLSFLMRSGEILGIAGIAGSGQKELCETIAGLMKAESGEIIFKGGNILGKDSREIIDLGITMSFIPEDRLGMGLVASMDMVDNIMLKDYYKQNSLFLDRKPSADKSRKIIKDLDVQTPGISYPVKYMSGGNIQKVLLGRELGLNPCLIITAYPTRGLDIGSSHLIYDILDEQKKKNVPILYIGEDLDVLMQLCDKIMVLAEGRNAGVVNALETTKEELGLMMTSGDDSGNTKEKARQILGGKGI
ncbi:MAG: ABC transporter ATP-binding protein [Candidatus Delongbacteria bacterium]|nr:ABC transporter ATP-binding protein [Candidatus Delongbacteria bacterium]MBN2834100.1 ABC transporter ATP-binding protein [Candidatus Delongbacteria bacterium]